MASNYLTIERAVGAEAVRDQLIRYAIDHVLESEVQYSALRQSWPRLYDLWRGTWTSRYAPHRNSIHMPLIFQALWANAARAAATSLSGYPLITFMGYGPNDMPTARKREALFAAQSYDDNLFTKQVDSILAASLYGTSITQIGWKRDEKVRVIETIDRAPISGQIIRSIRKGKVVMFDGPETKNVDLLDWFPQVGFRDIADMPRVGRRYFLDLEDVRYLASEGIFDKAEVARMEREGGVNTGVVDTSLSMKRFQSRVGTDDETARYMSKWNRPIECIDVWGLMPSELCTDGDTNRVVTVLNRRYLGRNRPMPFWHGLKPFVANRPMPDPHYHYAPGKAEIVAKLQIVANRYINQSLDAADLMIDPMWFYDKSAGIRMSNLVSRPGKMVGVNGNPNQAVAQFQRDMSGLTVADKQVAMMRGGIQMGTGIADDVVAGMDGSDRQTAREFVGRREAAGTRLLLEAQLYEKTALEPIANLMMANNRQFLDLPVEVLILGEGAKLDPVTNQPIPDTREVLDGFDLTANYAARAIGASTSLSKSMKQQNLLALLQAMGTPLGQQALGQINAVNFFRTVFREFEIPNINEMFQMNPALAGLVPNGMTPGAVPTSGQMATTMQPEQLAAMGGPQPGSAQALKAPIDISQTMPPGATALPAQSAA